MPVLGTDYRSVLIWGRGDFMVTALVSGFSDLGSIPGWGHCVVFFGKTL